MSKAGGLVLIVGGLTVAAYVMAPDDDASGSEAARQAEFAKSARVEQRPGQDIAVPMPQPAFRPIASRPAPKAEFAFTAPVVVTVAPRAIDAAASPIRAAAIPRDRDTLARELQKELRRVGCYDGELNGAWTPATRKAMKAFTDRVNASLPVEEPDAVLFTMVRGQQDRVCGRPCPGGQGLSEDGRCVPNAILAKATKRTSPPPATAVIHVPTVTQLAAEKPAPAITGWSTTVTATTRTPASAVAGTPAPPQALAAAQLAPALVEGRMSLAGPSTADAIMPAIPERAAVVHPAVATGKAANGRSRPVVMAAGTARTRDWKRHVFEQR
jgi:hypothetical protein